MTKEELKAAGWHTYYHEEYWVHKDLVKDDISQDYTNYGVPLNTAVKLEQAGRPKSGSIIDFGLLIAELTNSYI